MTPFFELTQGETPLETRTIESLSVDSPLRDWRQTMRISSDLKIDDALPLTIYAGYYPIGKIKVFEGGLLKRKSEKELVFTTRLPDEFGTRNTMDTTPQAAVKRELSEFGLECIFQETLVRHEIILDGSVYYRLQALAETETPERSWWITPEGKAWWGIVDQSPRWNAEPIWLDTRQTIVEIDTRAKTAEVLFMPWVRGGHCVVLDDPVDRQELIQSAALNVVHRFERKKGYFTEISYL